MTGRSDAAEGRGTLAELESAFGVRFDDRGLLRTAVTHRSYLNEVAEPDSGDNERLEFLGDALLDFVAADFLYRLLPQAREGELTALRAALVCERALADYATDLELGRFLRLGRGEAAGGGRYRPAILCNAFEALVGALYLDQGYGAAEVFVMSFLEPELTDVLKGRRLKDAKSALQELTQRLWQVTPVYLTVDESGPDHQKQFVVAVKVGDDVLGTGEGGSKTMAARLAAQEALDRLRASDASAQEPAP
jgi:ribonuclease-3